ncbi:MAG: phosphosulfolactate synthase [Methanocella sp.]
MGELVGEAEKAWSGIVGDPFPDGSVKPRTTRLTAVIDKGLGLAETQDLLELAGDYLDYVKLAFGTSALYGRSLLGRKIQLIRAYGIHVYPGGTFLEVAYLQGRIPEFVTHAAALGFTALEVSDGTVTLPPEERSRAIRIGRAAGLTVLTEVGKKDTAAQKPAAELRRQLEQDLAEGATHVIVEGRESGKGVGIFDARGEVKEDDMEALALDLPDPSVLIWEAPLKSQQEALIARFGPDVNLGNVPTTEVLALEALRRGLRGDTLRLYLERVK